MDIEKAVVAKLNIRGNVFEILVDCEHALKFKRGEDVNLDDVLATNDIFKDIKKGEHASNLAKFFNTEDKKEIAKQIIKKGEIQLTAEYKQKLRDEKKKKIINLIHANAVNPENNLPHPITRIEIAMHDAKVKIDEFKSAEEQIKDVIDKLRPIIPIKYEVREIAVKIPAQYSGKSFSVLKRYGKMLKEEWGNDGSLLVALEIPGGLQMELIDKLNDLTKGSVDVKIMNVR
ncbi:MAG: ribosome assembly factor SBDS [Nanoarchaeota archaeon]|nr:ribosome assembly factor SBDS [Nanoarchaeota archaeon]